MAYVPLLWSPATHLKYCFVLQSYRQEASLAWTKRQAEIRRRVEAAAARSSMASYDMDEQPAHKKTGWSFWGMGAGFGAATGST